MSNEYYNRFEDTMMKANVGEHQREQDKELLGLEKYLIEKLMALVSATRLPSEFPDEMIYFEVAKVEREILAKVRQHYPIMFEEEAELDGYMMRHGWLPPVKIEEAKREE